MGEDENVIVQNMSLSGELADRYCDTMYFNVLFTVLFCDVLYES